MSGAEKIDRAERRNQAETRLMRSRPAREAAAAAHAGRMGRQIQPGLLEQGDVASSSGPERPAALSSLESKILDAANDVLASKGRDGEKIADLIRTFVTARDV